MFAITNLPSIHEKEEQKDVFLLKSSFATSPTILLSSPGSTYSGTHHRRRSSGISKQLMATTTSLDAAHQYQWAPAAAVNFPPSPSATPALSSRVSSPESSPQSLTTLPSLPLPSAPPSPSPSPPPYSVYANDVHQIATLAASLQKQQMPVGTRTATTTTTTLDGPPSRLNKQYQRPPIPLKPSALRLVSSSKTTVHSASTKGWRRFMHSGFTWIGLYFVFNMGLTLYNKTVLLHFPFPYSLTALHTLCGTIGCLWLRNIGYFTPARLTVRQNLTLAAFSVLYTLNIAVSNLSLQLVTVPFHQVVRASAPFFTILVAYLLSATRGKGLLGVGGSKLLSLVPVIAGVGFATYGDYSFTAWGFILTLFGTFLAALKTVLTSILQTPSASSRLSTPLPVSTPVTAKPGYEYGLPPSPTSNSFSNGGNVTPPKSPYLSAHHQTHPRSSSPSSSSSSSSSSTAFHSSSSSLAKHFAPLKRIFKRFGFISKRFDMDFGDMSHQTVVSTSIKLHPLDLLMRMSPLAFVQCVFYAWLSGELERAAVHKGPGLEGWSRKSATVLLLNGIIAFLLNIVSLTANQKNGPLTMTVAANVKQVLTILLAMYMFHLTITPANTIGIALTLAGGAWYGALEYEEKKNRLRMV